MHIKASTRRLVVAERRPAAAAGTSRRRRIHRGSAIIEASFIALTFALLLIGVFDCGQFLYIHQALVERARSATRWGVVQSPIDTTAVQNMVLYNQPTAPSPPADGYFGLTSTMVQVTNPGSGTSDFRLVVLITNYPYPVFSPLIGGTFKGPNITVSVPLGLT